MLCAEITPQFTIGRLSIKLRIVSEVLHNFLCIIGTISFRFTKLGLVVAVLTLI